MLFEPQAQGKQVIYRDRELFWLAEASSPFDPSEIFVTIGDSVAVTSGRHHTHGSTSSAVIVGAEGILPVVRFTDGPKTGQTMTIAPDDIVAALILARLAADV